MTTVRIALIEPWPGQRMSGRGFRISSFLVALADDSSGRALPVWLSGPEGHGLLRGHGHLPHPEPAEVITADLLRAAGVTVTGVDITAAGTAEPGQMPVRIGYALAMAAATSAPIRISDQLMDRFTVPAQSDLPAQFTRDVPVPQHRRHWPRLLRRHPPVRMASR